MNVSTPEITSSDDVTAWLVVRMSIPDKVKLFYYHKFGTFESVQVTSNDSTTGNQDPVKFQRKLRVPSLFCPFVVFLC